MTFTWGLLIAIILITLIASIVNLRVAGEKEEYAILQALAAQKHSGCSQSIEIVNQGNHKILKVCSDESWELPIWILLDPRREPFYKQIPANVNYTLSNRQLQRLALDEVIDRTVYGCLESHAESNQ